MVVLLRALRVLFPLLHLQRWILALMILLGVLAALSEGLSISLFIPLIQNQTLSANDGIIWRLNALFQGIPLERRFLWIALSILFCLMIKNVFSYCYSVLFHWVNASIGHRLRCGILHQLLSVSQSYLDGQDSGELLTP